MASGALARTFGIREAGNSKAIVLIHGFRGEAHSTFGMLPAYLAGMPRLYEWDLWCVGYSTGLAPDITGVWSADPDLAELAGQLDTLLKDGRLADYGTLAVIAHSMGGLVAQRAVLDGSFGDRLRHLHTFSTPSGGKPAGWLWVVKRQVRDMQPDSAFMKKLHADWLAGLPQLWASDEDGTPAGPGAAPFDYFAAWGTEDQFVTRKMCHGPVSRDFRRFVPGDHSQVVKPLSPRDEMVDLLLRRLDPAEPGEGGPAAGEAAAVRLAKELLSEGQVDDQAVGVAVFELERRFGTEAAQQLLEGVDLESTELQGIYAGRLKRRWLADPHGCADAGDRALEVYRKAYEEARAAALAGGPDEAKHHAQAFYNGINVAFMLLACKQEPQLARETAVQVQEHCAEHAKRTDEEAMWRLATLGDVLQYRGEPAEALRHYAGALELQPDRRQRSSILQQAVWISRLLEDQVTESELRLLFGD